MSICFQNRTLRIAPALLALLLACLMPAADALAAEGKGKQPPVRYWGAWIGDQITGTAPPEDMSAVSHFQQVTGNKGLSIIMTSVPFANCETNPCYPIEFPSEGMHRIRAYGAIPMLSWSSFAASGEGHEAKFSLATVSSGAYDAYIREFAEDAADWGHPFFLRFNWEMNGDWFPWGQGVNGNGPGSFVHTWRHVHNIFRSVGATNATWVWCPYADPRHRFHPLAGVYPGDEYVDWTCMDGYNWGHNPLNPVPWMSFEKIFASTYRRIVTRIAPSKPMMLAELATTGDERSKSTWIRRMFKALRGPDFRRIRAIVWFDQIDRSVDWLLENSAPAAGTFAKGIRRGYRPNMYANLSESPIRPPAPTTVSKPRSKRR
jgi:hypothetical protein